MLNKLIYFFVTILAFALNQSHLFARITETKELSMIQDTLTPDALVLVNIPGTLYEPATTLADKRWKNYFVERVHSLILDQITAERLINQAKYEIANRAPKKPTKDVISPLIAYLQGQNIPVLGLMRKKMATSYTDHLELIIQNHLLNLGINFENTLSYLDIKKLSKKTSHSFAHGLLFTNKYPTGQAILEFIDQLHRKPTKIILIDHSYDELEHAEAILMPAGVSFEGFRYGRLDARPFDPVIGSIQFLAFMCHKQILSDEQAREIKEANPEVDFIALLDRYIQEQTH